MKQIPMHSNPEIAWLIGILEGEGSFSFYSGCAHAKVNMIDKDVLERAADVIESIIGKRPPIKFQARQTPNRQDQWRLQVYGRHAEALMLVAIPHMSERRRGQIWRMLNKHQYDHSINLVKLLRPGEAA